MLLRIPLNTVHFFTTSNCSSVSGQNQANTPIKVVGETDSTGQATLV